MPLQKLAFTPGTNRESTNYGNEGGWYQTNKVRFRSGLPEKIGGWTKDAGILSTDIANVTTSIAYPTTGTLWGVCRSLWNWVTLSGYNLLGLGTNLKYYIQNGTGGLFYDITPITGIPPAAISVASNAFTTTASSSGTARYVTVTCNVSGYNGQTNDFVTISGVASAVNGIPAANLNAEFQITYVSSSTFTIQVYVSSAVTVTAGTTGAAAFAVQISTGGDVYTVGVGWGSGGWGGSTGPSVATALTSAITSTTSTGAISVSSTTGFAASGNIVIDTEIITYPSVTATTFASPVVRGVGTTAATHTVGTPVYQYSSTATGWGAAAPIGFGIGLQLRTWSESNYGQNLVLNPRGGAIYYWVADATPTIFNRAQVVSASNTNTQNSIAYWDADSTCPTVCNFVLVSDSSRFTIAFGTNDPTGVYATAALDPMQIRWSNQEDLLTWTPAITNQAGDYRLSHGSAIIMAQQTRQEVLVFTDSAIYSMQYIGPPYVWSFQILGDNISIAGPNAVATATNITYWMGLDQFYQYSGRVDVLPSTLREYVFTDINRTQSFQIVSGTNEGYNEVWWQYCSSTSNVIDRYVIYNYKDNVWYYGDWANYNGAYQGRTAWLDSALRASPMATAYGVAGGSSNAILVYHESGVDDGTVNPAVPIVANVQSSDFDIGDGNNFGFVWRLIPDLTFDGSSVNTPTAYFTAIPRTFPGAAYGSSNNPAVQSTQNYQNQITYNVQQFTQQIYVRIRGRQMAFKVSSGTTGSTTDGLGVQWQLGAPRIDLRPDGRR
jgi:hypothetical protein